MKELTELKDLGIPTLIETLKTLESTLDPSNLLGRSYSNQEFEAIRGIRCNILNQLRWRTMSVEERNVAKGKISNTVWIWDNPCNGRWLSERRLAEYRILKDKQVEELKKTLEKENASVAREFTEKVFLDKHRHQTFVGAFVRLHPNSRKDYHECVNNTQFESVKVYVGTPTQKERYCEEWHTYTHRVFHPEDCEGVGEWGFLKM